MKPTIWKATLSMPAVLCEPVAVMQQRQVRLPLRPDHGHQMLDDRPQKINPGYSAIGRLRSLELGISRAIGVRA